MFFLFYISRKRMWRCYSVMSHMMRLFWCSLGSSMTRKSSLLKSKCAKTRILLILMGVSTGLLYHHHFTVFCSFIVLHTHTHAYSSERAAWKDQDPMLLQSDALVMFACDGSGLGQCRSRLHYILVLLIEMSDEEDWITPKMIGEGARRKVERENVISGDGSDYCGTGFSIPV